MDTKWKMQRDVAEDALEAERVVTEALSDGTRPELLQFLGELYKEFIGPDEAGGGETGTLEAMRRVHDFLKPTGEELVSVGINPEHLSAYLHHDDSVVASEAVQQVHA